MNMQVMRTSAASDNARLRYIQVGGLGLMPSSIFTNISYGHVGSQLLDKTRGMPQDPCWSTLTYSIRAGSCNCNVSVSAGGSMGLEGQVPPHVHSATVTVQL